MAQAARKQVLFVDDEANFLNGIKRMLRGERGIWEFHFAYSANEALERAQETMPDVIVSDVQMPGRTGLDLLQDLQSSEGLDQIPVIILTGNAESNLKRRALDLGATDLLNKPVNREDLVARLRSVLRLKEYQDDIRNQNIILEERVRERTQELEQSRVDILFRLAKAGELRDEETGDHVMRVAWCSGRLADRLGLDQAKMQEILLASPLHDIGKIGVPDGILLKTGRLDESEREYMERHCAIGAAILLEEPRGGLPRLSSRWDTAPQPATDDGRSLIKRAAEIALHHHERWDGSGYPDGLAGDDIPIAAQVVAVADVYDALRSTRSYKESFSVEKSASMMSAEVGTHFSEKTIGAFLELVEEFEDIRRRYSD